MADKTNKVSMSLRRCRRTAVALGLAGAAIAAGAAEPFGTPTFYGWSFNTPLLPNEIQMFDGSTLSYRDTAYISGGYSASGTSAATGQSQVFPGDGFARYDTVPMGWSSSSTNCPVACILNGSVGAASTALDVGTLHASASVIAAGNNDVWYDNGASATAVSVVGETVTLDQEATITVNGHLSGSLIAAWPGAGNASVSLWVAVIDPTQVDVADEHFGPIRQAEAYAIESFANGGSQAAGSQDFSFGLDLSEGDNYILVSLAVSATSGTDFVHGGSAEANFADTAALSFVVPDGVQFTTSTGMLQIASVPEPATGRTMAFGLAALGWLARRRRAR